MIELLTPQPDTEVPEPLEQPTVPEVVGTRITADGERIAIERAQDCEPIVDFARERAANAEAWSSSGELLHLAEFPAVIVERYCTERGITFEEFMRDQKTHVRALLSDPALSAFRVWDNVVHKTWR